MSGLLHVRLTVPSDLTPPVTQLLLDYAAATNVTVEHGACLDPVGDLLEADVAREMASDLLDQLRRLKVQERGGIVLTDPVATPFDKGAEIEQAAPGDPGDAVLWDVVLDQAETASRPSVTFFAFLLLATVLAAVAVVTDSAVLVVGAMVVGPEFAAVAAVCTGLVTRRWWLAARSMAMLVIGFVAVIVVVTALAWVGARTGHLTSDMVTRPRPQTGFIWHPDKWSFLVALVAGAAGVLALCTDKSSAMVGVFISVTTVPAAGNLALGLALAEGSEVSGSLNQLLVNLAGMTIAGVLTAALLRATWGRVVRRSRRWYLRSGYHRHIAQEQRRRAVGGH